MSSKTYIYERKEYVKTGRIAKKKEKTYKGFIEKELVEIRPSNLPENETSFNLWVDQDDLYIVE